MSALALPSASSSARPAPEPAVAVGQALRSIGSFTLAHWERALRGDAGPVVQELDRDELHIVVTALRLARDLARHGNKPARRVLAAWSLYHQVRRMLDDLVLAAKREQADQRLLPRGDFDRLVLFWLALVGLTHYLCRVSRANLEELRRSYARRHCPAQTSDTFAVHTSQEASAILRALSDGRSGRHWSVGEQAGVVVWSPPGSAYSVQIAVNREERSDGLKVSSLDAAFGSQDLDSALAALYILQLLAPKAPMLDGTQTGVWIDLDDVASKVWPTPRSFEERLNNRSRVYAIVAFCARASVIGRRSGTYKDRETKAEISTSIECPIWAVLGQDRAYVERITLPFEEDIPLRVEMVCSRGWAGLMARSDTAQYLPGGELISSIPGKRPSGALARALGLALLHFWRRTVRETIDRSRRPTRRELLSDFRPTTGAIQDVLASKNPSRALQYWREAVAKLVKVGILANEGDVAADHLGAPGRRRYAWQEQWLDDHVDLRPGPMVLPTVAALASHLPAVKPRDLRADPAKRKRPRKARHAHS